MSNLIQQNLMKNYLIAGNWKMNKTASEAKDFLDQLNTRLLNPIKSEVLVCPPFTALASARKHLGSVIKLGAQNVHPEVHGAFTGEISISMLTDLGLSYVIVGHSERRTIFGETDRFVNEKVRALLASPLNPILCVGESLEERKTNKTFEVIGRELEHGLQNVSATDAGRLTIAYEPIWAIGTGETATPEIAQSVHHFIREWLKTHFNAQVSDAIRLLYGGSLKASNAHDLLSQEDIDGGLIGGASLKVDDFLAIIREAEKLS